MKLTKIKLINWHLFSNTTLDIVGDFMITGENGSGKSTLIDAMYFLLSGGDSNHFNSAANANSKRTLVNYMKGRIGSEEKEFIRSNKDIISHIAMEFYDEKAKNYRILGTILELSEQNQNKPKSFFYQIVGKPLEDSLYFEEKNIRNINEFKKYCKGISAEPIDLGDSIVRRKDKIGREVLRLEDSSKYPDLLRSAIAFKPIDEVSTFVNNFLLKEDVVNIDSLVTEIRQYQELKNQITKAEQKLASLKSFIPDAEVYQKNVFDIKHLEVVYCEARIAEANYKISLAETSIRKQTDVKNGIDAEMSSQSTRRDGLLVEKHNIENNDAFRAVADKRQAISNAQSDLKTLNEDITRTEGILAGERKISSKLGFNYRFKEDIDTGNFALLKEHIRSVDAAVVDKISELNDSKADKKAILNKLHTEYGSAKERYDLLLRGKSTYDSKVQNLIAILRSSLKEEFGKDLEIRPLCEYMEIKDKRWVNAIEGYLGQHRFDLVIDKKYYDFAIKTYESLKTDCDIDTVGIAKCETKLMGYKPSDNTLFSKIVTDDKNSNAAAYYLLNDVMCVDGVEDLIKYEKSITDTCMVHENKISWNVDPTVYQTPFIGADSIIRRKELYKKQCDDLASKIAVVNKEIADIENELAVFKNSKIHSLIELNDIWSERIRTQSLLGTLEDELKTLQKESGVLAFEDSLNRINAEIEKLKQSMKALNDRKTDVAADIKRSNDEIAANRSSIEEITHDLQDQLGRLDAHNDLDSFRDKYMSSKKDAVRTIWEALTSAKTSNSRKQQNILNGMSNYCANHNTLLTPSLDEIGSFINEYHKIENQELVKYSRKAKDALENCQTSFKEDFVLKIYQKLESAKKQLRTINKALEKNPFGNDQEVYEFVWSPSKDDEMRQYYDIISKGKLFEQTDLLTEAMSDKERDVIEGLLNKLVEADSVVDGEKKIRRYLDHRNYMVYDIKSTNKYNETQFFSKTNKEKSGGETQTPFYVVIAACFDRLIKNGQATNDSSACIVIYDEAFNNMDEGRISALMDYYEKLNIQLAIVVPSNRSSLINGYVDTSIGLVKQKNVIRAASIKRV